MNAEEGRKGMLSCLAAILKKDGMSGLFTGLPLIMLRQIPYTCVKLSSYEVFSRIIKRALSKLELAFPHTFEDISEGQLAATKQLLGGIFAGVSAAIVSQPADVLLSKL